MTNLLALPAGTELAGDFRIERVLGAGGFGITYLAEETSLARRVTIKEYFPADFAARNGDVEALPRSQNCADDYKWGLDRFLEEAQILAKFNHPNIVRVYRYFRANNTGYIVLHFEEGQSFKNWQKSLGRAPRQHELDQIVGPLLDALELIHNSDFLHRDIAPDNIIIRKDGSPVLIDFGSARGDIAQHSMTVSALVKPGYSPYEQYATTSRQQGPWSDIYSLGATLYQAVTNKRPPDAPSRMVVDELIPARDAALSAYRPAFLEGIDRALSLDVTGRPKSIAVWRKSLLEPTASAPGKPPAEPAAAPALTRKKAPAKSSTPLRHGLWRRSIAAALKARPRGRKPAARPAQQVNKGAAAAPAPARRALLRRASSKVTTRPRRRRSWRPLAVKLLIGLGVASAAVAMQDRFPIAQRHNGGTELSQAGEPAPIAELTSHKGAVSGVAFASEGRWIVSSSTDGTLKVWSSATNRLLHTLELNAGPASALAAQGQRAVSGHQDGTVALWDLETNERLAAFKRSDASIWSVTFAGDPDRFAAASFDWTVTLYDAKSKTGAVHVFEGHENTIRALAYSTGGSVLASGGADRTVRLWNAAAYAPIRTYRGHNDYVTALALSRDGRTLASASSDGAIRIWSTSTNQAFRTLRGHNARIAALAFSPDGHILASAGSDAAIRLWNVKRGETMRTLLGHQGEVLSVSFSPDGRRLASGGGDGIVRLWDASGLRPAS